MKLKSPTKYIEEILYLVKTKLTNPESALLLQEEYYDTYLNKEDEDVERVLGSCVKRAGEDIADFNNMGPLLEDFIKYDIHKFFGLTSMQFLDLTPFSRRIHIQQAIEHIKKLEAEYENLADKQDETLKSIRDYGIGE